MKFHHRWVATAILFSAVLGASSLTHAASVGGQGTWETTLQGRDLDGNLSTAEAYYDSALNITWLADANYAQTSGRVPNGGMGWADTSAWVAGLNFNGISGWRLPTVTDTGTPGCGSFVSSGGDCGYNVSTATSEMAHMFFVTLGDLSKVSPSGTLQPGWGLSNTGPFANLAKIANNGYNQYWTATDMPGVYAPFYFDFQEGLQSTSQDASYGLFAWAVHAGDVGATVVPVPAAVWLFGSGLLGLIGMARRKAA